MPITLARDDVWEMIKKSTHLAELNLGGTTEMVLVRDVQWDHLGKEIIHLDFARVSADESIETEVRLDAPRHRRRASPRGACSSSWSTRSTVTCRANAIPDSIRVDVSHLHLNAGDPRPRPDRCPRGDGRRRPRLLLVHVVTRAAEAEPTAAEAEGADPARSHQARAQGKGRSE